MPDLTLLVIQIAVIVFTSRLTGRLFQAIHQPSVVGEMSAGIFLGPSVLGLIAPGLSGLLFPSSSIAYLNAFSQVGLLIFMFLVGLGINISELRKLGNSTLLISHASIMVPFVSGSVLALFLYRELSDESVSFVQFSLFMGAAMSITAFPVLARILRELNMLHTRLGTLAIACAAVDDVTGWCILACIIALVRCGHSGIRPLLTLLGAGCFLWMMIYVVRPQLRRLETSFARRGELSEGAMVLVLLLVLASALCTQALGVHLLFGAFLMGAIMPRDRQLIRHFFERLETVTVTLLLPLFFAATGLRTNIGVLRGEEMWMPFGAIMLVATAGKLGGCMLASRLSGMQWREAAGLGVLINTRGLMELVVLNIGLDYKVLSSSLFSMMVLMAVVTTFMTVPALKFMDRENLASSGNEKPATLDDTNSASVSSTT